ncbi:MAG: hypothetical protein M0Z28_10220 [Rhodospirillales bacterium]|nr:hypothetical protein [Rhodospirillales bacterium]
MRRLYGLANPVHGQHGTRPGGVSDSAMAEAMPTFEALALEGPAFEPAVRLTQYRGAVWIDLGDDTHRAIRVTADGWTIEARADAPLIRPEGMRPLPVPVRASDAMAKLRKLVNIGEGDEADMNFRLVVAWLVAALYPTGPYCVLAVDGEQGSGKSTSCRMLRRLVDPNAADLRAPPRNEDDLLIAALNGRVIGLDNVSFIEADMADAICRIATGAGFGKRRLYADAEEVIISVARPVLLNGIPSLLARGDLADRSITVTLPPIPDANRRPEAKVWRDFNAAAPGILAALLDGLATALRRLPTLRLASLPRMADFARLACAAAPAFGWTEGEMLAALAANRVAAVHTVIEADPLAEAVQAIGTAGNWRGSATQLLEAVNMRVPPDVQRGKGWPKDAARLSARLRRVTPALRRAGIEVRNDREGKQRDRVIIIERVPPATIRPEASAASADRPPHMDAAENREFLADDGRTLTDPSASANGLADADRVGARGSVRQASAGNPQKSAIADAADAADADPYSLAAEATEMEGVL